MLGMVAISGTLRVAERGQRPVETLFLANLNYWYRMSGPALGSILTASAALEACLRALGRAHFAHQIAKRNRSSTQVTQKVAEFDRRPVWGDARNVGKVNYLFQSLLRRDCPRDIGDEIKATGRFSQ